MNKLIILLISVLSFSAIAQDYKIITQDTNGFYNEVGIDKEDLPLYDELSKVTGDKLINLEILLYIDTFRVENGLKPYERVYFASWDDKYRITIDTELKYRKINKSGVSTFFITDNIVVVEVKFAECDFVGVSNITKYLSTSA
jgi:hypothetical protein